MSNKLIILIYSPSPSTGKTTFTEYFVNSAKHGNYLHESFAGNIKERAYNAFRDDLEYITGESLNYQEFCQEYKDVKIDKINLTPRELVISYSEMAKKIFGRDVWVKLLKRDLELYEFDVCVIDDWRLPEDYNYLQSPNYKIIKVYLDKEDLADNKLSFLANTYEGKISPDLCDYHFTFKNDWSNHQEIEDKLHGIVFDYFKWSCG